MSAVVAGVADDIIDALLVRSGGAVLRAPADSTSGEYDGWRQGFSRRDVRRLTGAGLVARDGWEADRLQRMFDGCWDLNADEFCTWWMTQGLAGLDQRSARRAGVVEREQCEADYLDSLPVVDTVGLLAEIVGCAAIPQWFHAWCERTVHPPKLDVLVMLGAARWLDVPAGAMPSAAWVAKLQAKFDRRCQS